MLSGDQGCLHPSLRHQPDLHDGVLRKVQGCAVACSVVWSYVELCHDIHKVKAGCLCVVKNLFTFLNPGLQHNFERMCQYSYQWLWPLLLLHGNLPIPWFLNFLASFCHLDCLLILLLLLIILCSLWCYSLIKVIVINWCCRSKWKIPPFFSRTQSWWGQWPTWRPARERQRQSWLQKREPSASIRWEPATAMLNRYRLSLIWFNLIDQVLTGLISIYLDLQAGRLQYTCKYTADDLKKTLAQVLAAIR